MGLGRQAERQNAMWISCDLIPKSRGHAFYDRLQSELTKSGFDRFAEDQCAPFYDKSRGRRSIPPGRYFRMLLVGSAPGLRRPSRELKPADDQMRRGAVRGVPSRRSGSQPGGIGIALNHLIIKTIELWITR